MCLNLCTMSPLPLPPPPPLPCFKTLCRLCIGMVTELSIPQKKSLRNLSEMSLILASSMFKTVSGSEYSEFLKPSKEEVEDSCSILNWLTRGTSKDKSKWATRDYESPTPGLNVWNHFFIVMRTLLCIELDRARSNVVPADLLRPWEVVDWHAWLKALFRMGPMHDG